MTTIDYEEYKRNQGERCPACGSEDIEGGPLDVSGNTCGQEMGCSVCNLEWIDRYTLTGITVTGGLT